jgi:3-dehydroquinate synthetase
MIDASIGGKTAINTPSGKNLIGTFYSPKVVICDSQTLQTLPEKEKLNGLAEILKIGLTSDPSIWDLNKIDEELILKAIKKKIEIVEEDPFEKGIRRVLNFGHTIGHALETVTNYTIAHGEAVWLGCVAESYLSHLVGLLSLADFHKIHEQPLLSSFKWPTCHLKKISRALFFDKKKELGKIRFVLIDQIGHTVPFEGNYCSSVDPKALDTTLCWMKDHYG